MLPPRYVLEEPVQDDEDTYRIYEQIRDTAEVQYESIIEPKLPEDYLEVQLSEVSDML
jgi:hypothetical protein